jgi:hypothetical protein
MFRVKLDRDNMGRRGIVVVLNSRTVFFMMQDTKWDHGDHTEWSYFRDSQLIK